VWTLNQPAYFSARLSHTHDDDDDDDGDNNAPTAHVDHRVQSVQRVGMRERERERERDSGVAIERDRERSRDKEWLSLPTSPQAFIGDFRFSLARRRSLLLLHHHPPTPTPPPPRCCPAAASLSATQLPSATTQPYPPSLSHQRAYHSTPPNSPLLSPRPCSPRPTICGYHLPLGTASRAARRVTTRMWSPPPTRPP